MFQGKKSIFKLLIAMLTLMIFVLPACISSSGGSIAPGICSKIPPGECSVICQVAQKFNVAPESVSAVLKITNVAALAANKYTAAQAKVFIDKLRAFLQGAQQAGCTWESMFIYLVEQYKTLPPEAQASLEILKIYMGDATFGPQVLCGYDYDLLLLHLDKQDAVLAPFLVPIK